MVRKILNLGLFILLASCASSMTENRFAKSEASITGGRYQATSWKDSLHLPRNSWYQGATLYFDAIIAEIPPQSPFYQWLAHDVSNVSSRCAKFFIGATHSFLLDRNSQSELSSAFTRAGAQELTLLEFTAQWKMHPDTIRWGLTRYKIRGYCFPQQASIPEELLISIPGFNTAHLELGLKK